MMHVPYGELFRVSGDALRMLGFSIGQSDDAAHCLMWTESVLHRGYAMLRQADRARPEKGWERTRVLDETSPVRVDMRNAPLLLYGARIADLAIASLADSSVKLSAEHTFGGWIVPFIADRMMKAGLASALLWKPNGGNALESPVMLVVATPQAGEICMLAARESGVDGKASREGEASAEDVALFDPQWFAAAKAELTLLATTKPVASHPAALARALARAAGLSLGSIATILPTRAVEKAIASGLDVAREDHAFLGSVVRRRWLPTSERSRTQAG